MMIRNKKLFSLGMFLTITFFGVLFLIFMPVFNGKNGLQYADDSFNKLAKGSSYFIPKVSKSVEIFVGKPLSISINLDRAEDVEKIAKLFTEAGAKVDAKDRELKIEGDLGAILLSALKDADAMYKNDGKSVSERYGYNDKEVMKIWWKALNKIEKDLKKEKLVAEAKAVSDVIKKAVEPGYNFYQIDAYSVKDHLGMMTGLLVFYVLYTIWWGFAILYLFEGVGLSTKKAKVKKEV